MKTWLKYKCRAKIPCFFQSSLLLWSGQLYNTVSYKYSLPLLLWPKKPSQCYIKHTSPGRLPSRVLGVNLSILEIHFLTLLSGCPQLTSLALAPFSRINSKFLFELSRSRSPVHLLSNLDTPSTPCFSRNEQPGARLCFLPAQPPLCGTTSPSACSPTTLGPSSFYDPASLTWKCAFSVPKPGQPQCGSGWKTTGSGVSEWSLLSLLRSLLPTMTTSSNPHTLPSLLPYLQPSQMIASLISLWKLRLNSLNFCPIPTHRERSRYEGLDI